MSDMIARGLALRAQAVNLVRGIVADSAGAASANAARINAALAEGGNVGVTEEGEVYVDSTLLIPSNTHLHLGPGTTLKLAAGSDTYLIRNSDHTNGNVNIGLSGGTLDSNMAENAATGIWPTAWNGSAVCLVNVDYLRISGQRGLNAPKFVYQIAGCNNVWVDDLDFDTGSDGVHVNGPARHVFIRNISGTCGDDMVAFTGSDYPSILTIPGGDIYDVSVENVHGADTEKALVKLLAGGNGTLKLRRATVRGVKGSTTGSAAVAVNDDSLEANTTGKDVSEVVIEDVDCSVPAGYPLVQIGGVAGSVFKVANLHIRHGGLSINGVDVYGTVKTLTISGLSSDDDFKGNAVDVKASATVSDLQVRGVAVDFLNGSGRWLYAQGAVTRAQFESVATVGGGQGVVTTGASGSIGDLYLSNMHVNAAYYIVEHGGASEMKVHLSNVVQDAAQVAGFRASGTGALSIVGSGFVRQGNATACLARTAAQTLKVNCPSFPADVSLLTKTRGDYAYNTNAALACGEGVVTSDGTNWKNVYSDATY